MNILFLCSRFPFPLNRGDKLRAFNIARALSSANHRLFLISFVERRSDYAYVDSLRGYFEQVITEYLPPLRSRLNAAKALFSRLPLQVAYYKSKNMKKVIDSFLRGHEIDMIYVHLFRMASYVENHKDIYTVLDFTDVVSNHLERSIAYRGSLDKMIYSLEWPRIRAYEDEASLRFDECWVISRPEAEFLSRFAPDANVRIVPIGVDIEMFKPAQTDKEERIVFVGYLKSAYNVDAVEFFCREILPRIKADRPQVRFYAVGDRPHRKLRQLAKEGKLELTGFVRDLPGFLNKSKVLVAPFRFCSGIQTKVLEAMASGLPVVSTSLVNKGLGATPGREILIADDPKEFSDLVIRILADGRKREKIGLQSRQFVKTHFNWDSVVRRVEEIQNCLLANRLPFEQEKYSGGPR